MSITKTQRQLLAHTLGATERYMKKDWGFRNYFTTDEGCHDVQDLRNLVSIGLMVERSKFDSLVFLATKKGAIAVGFKKYQLSGKKFPS